MQRTIEQAGSVFAGWISSCLFCLDSSGDDVGIQQQAMKQKAAEREICHSQPHLVSPMKLVVYDDLPGPGRPRASSFPTWMMEGSRNLASRASSRASMSFKRKSTAPLRISAPTDFRRVNTLPAVSTVSTRYRPLELSFERPANRLPDLPSFSDFKFNEDGQQQTLLTRPQKALSFTTDFSCQTRPRTHRPSSSFQLPRKPVGSGSRRSSLATWELLLEKQVPVSHPLIPHFSTRSSTTSVATSLSPSTFTSPSNWPVSTMGSPPLPSNDPSRMSHYTASAVSQTPKPTTPQDKSLPPIPVESSLSSAYHPYNLPATPVHVPLEQHTDPSPPSSSSRSSRVTQWLLQTSQPSKLPTNPTSNPRRQSQSFRLSFRIRPRTLSGSTLASPTTNNIPIPGAFNPTATPAPTTPLSHRTPTAGTTITAAQTPALDSQFEKELEIPGTLAPRQTAPSTFSDRHSRTYQHPTIFEVQQNSLSYSPYAYDTPRHSAIGVAY
ncbi:hypothetical protein BJX61DRAFT_65393 [Aspergillus egyptiacus]|nr:hypothetical protein BJX61DRAFT_65393 [Aspergillus egyptiacus]